MFFRPTWNNEVHNKKSYEPKLCEILYKDEDILKHAAPAGWMYHPQLNIFRAKGYGRIAVERVLDIDSNQVSNLIADTILPKEVFLVFKNDFWHFGWHFEEVKVIALLLRKLYGRTTRAHPTCPEIIQLHKRLKQVREEIIRKHTHE